MSKRFKLDMFKTLAAIDRRDMSFHEKLSSEERKGFHAPVVLRWASATKGQDHEWYLAMVNERANLHFWEVHEHPELQYKLIAACGTGRKSAHDWIPNPKTKKMGPLHTCLSTHWPDANSMEIDILLSSFTVEEFGDFIDGSGMNGDDAKKIKKLFKDRL